MARSNFFQNLFNPVGYEDEANNDTRPTNRDRVTRVMSLKGRAERLRRYIEPDGDPKDNLVDEVDYLAGCLGGVTFPAGATLPQKIDFLDERVLGLKVSSTPDTTVKANSIGGAVDRMVAELKLTVAPDDDVFKKLESIERHLGIDSTEAAKKPLIDRAKVPYRMIFVGGSE